MFVWAPNKKYCAFSNRNKIQRETQLWSKTHNFCLSFGSFCLSLIRAHKNSFIVHWTGLQRVFYHEVKLNLMATFLLFSLPSSSFSLSLFSVCLFSILLILFRVIIFCERLYISNNKNKDSTRKTKKKYEKRITKMSFCSILFN